MGSMVTPPVKGNSIRFLNSGELGVFEVTAADLQAFLDLRSMPLIEGVLFWSEVIAARELL